MVQRVVFLHEDLMKLPSFPRKALEAELDLHPNGEIGKVKTVTKIVFNTRYGEGPMIFYFQNTFHFFWPF